MNTQVRWPMIFSAACSIAISLSAANSPEYAHAYRELYLEAEDYSLQDSTAGISNKKTYVTIHGFRNGYWVCYENTDFGNAATYTGLEIHIMSTGQKYLAKSDSIAGSFIFRLNQPDGPIIAKIPFGLYNLSDTTWKTLSGVVHNVDLMNGNHSLYLTYEGIALNRIDMDWFRFTGTGVETNPRSFYVSSSRGDDHNPGTLDKPFKTIAKASTRLTPGDICHIRGGIYHETLRPVNNGAPGKPITYTAYNNEKVVITGCDPLDVSWEEYENGTYKASLSWDLGRGNNELFSGLERLPEARFPHLNMNVSRARWNSPTKDGVPFKIYAVPPGDAPRDCMHPIFMEYAKRDCHWESCGEDHKIIVSFDQDELLNFPNDALVGGVYLMKDRWVYKSGIINKSYNAEGFLKVEMYCWRSWEWTQSSCMLLGAPILIREEGEWAVNDGMCYVKPVSGKNPADMNLMLKKRLITANLRYRSFIRLKNLHFLAGSLTMIGSRECLVEGCHFRSTAKYYYFGFDTGDPNYVIDRRRESGFYGSIVSGSNNTVRECSFVLSAGRAIDVDGENNRIENCLFSDMNYADPGAGVSIGGLNNVVTQCTIHDATRSGVSFGGGARKKHNGRLEYCDIYNTCLHSGDGASIYTYSIAAYSAHIAYNWFRKCFVINAGKHLYFDMVDAGVDPVIHHNVFFPMILKPRPRANLTLSDSRGACDCTITPLLPRMRDGQRAIHAVAANRTNRSPKNWVLLLQTRT